MLFWNMLCSRNARSNVRPVQGPSVLSSARGTGRIRWWMSQISANREKGQFNVTDRPCDLSKYLFSQYKENHNNKFWASPARAKR